MAKSRSKAELFISFYRIGGGNWMFHVYPVINGKPLDNLALSIVVTPRKRRMYLQSWNVHGNVPGIASYEHIVIPYEDREREIPGIPYGSRVTRSDMLSAVRNYAKYIYRKYYGLEIP